MKLKPPNSNREFVYPVVLLLSICIIAFFMVDNFGLTLFNIVFGKDEIAVTIAYQPQPVIINGQTLVKFTFTFNLTKLRAPIETLYTRFMVQNITNEREVELKELTLPISIYVGDVWNRKNFFSHTLTFQDGQARLITIYLFGLDTSYYRNIFVEINGSYKLLDNTDIPLTEGATLNVGTLG